VVVDMVVDVYFDLGEVELQDQVEVQDHVHVQGAVG
jgi:hypothetical protein